jgi:hypothetical protein
MIFPVLKLENIVQVNDKTRLDGSKSYTTPNEAAISLVEIEPESGAGFFDVTENKYLDWQYATNGSKSITLRITTDGSPITLTKALVIISAADDKLFSSDEQLTAHEPNILDYVRDGRNSFLDVHRASQDKILNWLDEHRIVDANGARLTKDAIVNIEEVSNWSKYMTLKTIFEGLSNSVGDVFSAKSKTYEELEVASKNKSQIRLDLDGDGEEDPTAYDLRTFTLRRK